MVFLYSSERTHLFGRAVILSLFSVLVVSALTFQFSIPTRAESREGMPVVSRDPPYFVDLQGDKITSLEVGQQVMIMKTLVHYNQEPQPFLCVIEVRQAGITEFLMWQTGVMPAAGFETGNSTMGFSWSANRAASYQVRAFVISSFEKPQILSLVAETEINAK